MANKIQNAWRSCLARNKFNKLQKLQYMLEKLVIKVITTDEDKKLATLMKWNKNARLIKCDEDARIIQNFCRKIHRKTVTKVGLKWKNLAKRIKPHIIYNVSKFIHMNNVLNKILKRRFFDNLIDRANKNYLKEILKYLIIKKDKEYNNNLLRRYLREWLDRARQLGDQDHYASTYIQSYYRGYLTRKHLHKDRKLQDILSKIILRIIYNSDATLPAAFQKWRKNARLVKCDEDARIIQDFCRNALDKIKKIKENEYLDKVYEGLDRLSNLRLNIRYAWDKIRDYNKNNALENLVGFLQDKINNVKRDVLEEIYQYGIDQVLRKLFPLRQKYINNLLRKKLRQWRDKANNLGRLRAAEMIQRNWFYYLIEKIKKRITILLRDIVIRKDESLTDKLRRILIKWKDNAQKLGRDAAEKRITKFLVERYLISKARNNWKNLADKLKRKIYKDSAWEVQKKLKIYITLKDLMNDLKDKIKKNGLHQLKEGDFWQRTIETLRIIFEDQDYRNKDIIKRIYLNRWMDKVKKLRERDNKLIDAMTEIEKRQLIKDVDTVADVETTKRFTDLIPVARAFDFFDRLRNLDKNKRNLLELKNNLLNKLIRKVVKRIHNILRKKLQQWSEKANKIREEACKNRIAKWIEERYRISNARKNWKKLADLYDLYIQKRPLYELRQKLIEYITLKELTKRLRQKLTKTGLDQFKEGVDFLNILKFLKTLFEDWDNRNKLVTLRHYIRKWNDKAKKLKLREDKLRDAMDEIEKRQLINDVNTFNNITLCKRVTDSIPVARAYDFYKKLREIDEYRKSLYNKRKDHLRITLEDFSSRAKDILRKKFLQWYEKTKKITEEIVKKRIAKWIEERYRISNARKNWKKLANLYNMFCQKRPLYDLRKKLIEYMTLKDMINKLKNRFTKEGHDQFKRGINYLTILKILKKMFENVDELNKFFTLKYYLNKWNDKAKKLKHRDDKLRDAMDEIEKRQLINDVNTITDVSRTKNFNDSIPVARAVDFFRILRDLERRRMNLANFKKTLLRKIVNYITRYNEDLLRKLLRQWLTTANKIKENAAKNRIAKWTEERYRISNARKNWKKLADLYDLYIQKRPLYELRQRLIKFITLRDLADKLRNRFTKTGNDQFKEGVKHTIILKYLKKLFEDVDEVNRLILLKQYLNKWRNNARKLKLREDKLRDAMDEI
ncbi:hypothetical protein IKN40_03405, partial [bacterium]|nr:hypothetical protein [bacterium]